MKLQIVAVLAIVAVAVAAPQNRNQDVPIVRQAFDQQPDGPFQYSFEAGNGISAQAQGELKQVVDEDNKPQQALVVRGEYSFVDDQGQQHRTAYYADETGYHADSADIPVAPVARR